MRLLSTSWESLYSLFTTEERIYLGINFQQPFVEFFLPASLYMMLIYHKKNRKPFSSSSISRIFKDDARVPKTAYDGFYKTVCQKNSRSGDAFTSETHPGLQHIHGKWDQAITELEEAGFKGFPENFAGNLDTLLTSILTEDVPMDIRQRLRSLRQESLSAVLTALTVIASTLPYWKKEPDSAEKAFYDLVLGPVGVRMNSKQRIHEDERRMQNSNRARNLLEEANILFTSSPQKAEDCKRLFDICQQIEGMLPLVEDVYCAEITFLCYRLVESGASDPPEGQKKEDYLRRSASYGNRMSVQILDLQSRPPFRREKSHTASGNPGLVWINCWNEASRMAIHTMPTDWELAKDKLPSFVKRNPKGMREKRLLFLDEDPEKNLEDFLVFLDRLYDSKMDPSRFFAIVRGPYSFLGHIIESALAEFKRNPPRVFLHDDVRLAVWSLLWKHPLFYPIRHIQDDETMDFHLVLLGDSEIAECLLLEGFHLLGFPNVSCTIHLLCRDAEGLKARANARCPALADGKITIKDAMFSKVLFQNVELETPQLSDWLAHNILPGTKCYFILAEKDGRRNMELAFFLREWTIRCMLSRQAATDASTSQNSPPQATGESLPSLLPPIAFYCPNTTLAKMVAQLVALKPSHARHWTNDYALIPFGSAGDLFRWDECAGGLLEKQALSLHWKYAEVQHHGGDDSHLESERSRFGRWAYPHESSLAAVVALPYRLFNIRSGTKRLQNMRILPPVWNILDADAYTSPYNRQILAKLFEEYTRFNKETVLEAMDRAEHARWCRFMLTRGWLPATTKDVQAFKTAGASTYKLYIAKMHACICPYDELTKLSDTIRHLYGKEKNFLTNDRTLVEATPKLLRLETGD